jgi:hypothetical protein
LFENFKNRKLEFILEIFQKPWTRSPLILTFKNKSKGIIKKSKMKSIII